MLRTRLLLLAAAALPCGGCVGEIRDTTTARTATEMLLVSTAAERALDRYDVSSLSGRKVWIDDSRFDSVDKPFVLSALRDHLSIAGARIVERDPDVHLEIRSAALGIWDGDMTLGVPPLPFTVQGLPAVTLPGLYIFRRHSQQGYAKFQFWTYDPQTMVYLSSSGDLWGHTYYNQWWWFGIGPFDGSNDVYPDLVDSTLPDSDPEDEGDGDGAPIDDQRR
ncbi:MAG: hypothetical protein KDD82_11190 [Planctomycetes bacterium]|nr:hypothetical protein [Planctomycetota bacterium]